MNLRIKNFVKNFSYTLVSNLISFLISTIIVLIIPKVIGVKEYGYWQLYVFYTSYVGFLHFGWNDGVYLRIGGKKYEELDKNLFFSQFIILNIFQLIIGLLICFISNILFDDINRIFIFQMVSLCMLIVNVRYMLLYILQSTNRIKEYAKSTMIDRIIYVCIIIIFFIIGLKDFKLMIFSDIIGKSISLIYTIYCCRDIVFNKISNFYFCFRDILENINVGIKLMFANIASMLIIGVIRFGIERTWDVSTFGKVSLTLSISNLMMLFINALGLIMFPTLRRTNEKELPRIYSTMRDFLMIILFGGIILYYPLRTILSSWLPKYSDSLVYMAIVFPMCIFEGKMSLLINTYLKTLRKEKLMLKINLISLSLSLIITFINCFLLKNLNLAITSIVILLAFRCVLAEIFLSKTLLISVIKDICLDLILTLTFILTGRFIKSWFAICIYLASYFCYILFKYIDIIYSLKYLIFLTRSRVSVEENSLISDNLSYKEYRRGRRFQTRKQNILYNSIYILKYIKTKPFKLLSHKNHPRNKRFQTTRHNI